MINKIKYINKKIIIKFISYIISFITLIYLLVFSYSYIFEQDKLAIDKYNFEQLEKVKTIINNDKVYNKTFRTIKEFNSIYNSDIKPINNCYFIFNYNGDEKFIFGFKLESILYKLYNLNWNYAYPKYDLPISTACVMGGGCIDGNYKSYTLTISNPCRD
ncbi:MAG: hypothetical protein PHS49_07285 [Candidatus Gracilibacteria bacterium]|nr:hypothetical protein [Candidatus Gracilibacteria bacterium]